MNTFKKSPDHHRAEESLEKNEAVFRGILDAVQDSIWLFSIDGIILLANETALSRMRKPREEVIGVHFSKLIPGELAQSRQARLNEVIETGQSVEMEDERAGIIFHHNFYPIKDADGRVLQVVVFSRDITERKQAEKMLRRFELLSENSRDIILFMRRDDGRILEANIAATQAYGYSHDELLALTIQDLRASDTQGLTTDQMAQADTGGILFETVHQRKDGSIFPVEVSSQGATIAGERTLISIVRDITGRKQAEEQIEQSNRKFNEILTSIQDDFYVLDRDWIFVYASRLFTSKVGKEPEDFVGKNIWEMFPKHVGTVLEENFRAVMEKGEVRRFELGGKYTSAWYSMTAFPSADGITVIGTDITERKRADAEVARLASFPERNPNPIVELDYSGNIVYINPKCRELFPNLTSSGLNHPLLAGLKQLVQKSEAGGLKTVLTQEAKAGNAYYYQTIVNIPEGRRIRLYNVDITEQKRVEEALRESSERLDLALISSKMATFNWDIVSDKRIWSEGVHSLLGTKPEFFTGEAEEFFQIIHPEDRGAVSAALTRAVETTGVYETEYRAVWPDDSVHYIAARGKVHYGNTGQAVNLTGVCWDITDRKQAEERVIYQARLLASVNDAIVGSDAQFRLTAWNACAESMYGWKADEIMGRNAVEFLQTEWPQKDSDLMRRMIVEIGRWRGEATQLRKDGTRIPVEVSSIALRDENGQIAGYVSVNRDITERKQAEEMLARQAEDLRRSNTELEQFAYVASHDLQEPLRIMSSYSQLLEKRYKGRLDTDADEFIDFIVEAAARMQKLITDLLAYSRAGRDTTDMLQVDCNKVLRKLVAGMAVTLESANGSVTFDELPVIPAHETSLVQLFQNLIGNALKFHGEQPPRIHVSARQADGEWVFSVQDNGIGIEPQYSQRIFMIFQRLHSREKYPGTGIGLSICKKIVENLGGRIWVESEPGQGSTFIFTVPIRKL